MIFRTAVESDFSEYERLYNDINSEALYRNEKQVDPEKQQEAIRWFGLDDEDTWKEFEEENKRTLEKFQNDLSKPYVKIIMILNSKRIIGFIELFEIKRFAWKIAYLCIEKRYQTSEVLKELVQYLTTKEKIRQLDVISFCDSVINILTNVGFKESKSKYYFRRDESG